MGNQGIEELLRVARDGDPEGVRVMLDEEPSLAVAAGPDGVTLLHVAAERDDVSMAVLALDRGADPHVEAGWGQTPFEWAANMGSERVARLLMTHDAARATLWSAAALGMLDEVERYFVDGALVAGAGRAPKPGADLSGWPEDAPFLTGDAISDALYIAIRNGHRPVAELLLARGGDIDAVGYFGATGLHWAAIAGREEIARWAVDHGADVHRRDPRFDATPAGLAREAGHEELARFLAEREGRADGPASEATDSSPVGEPPALGLPLTVGQRAVRVLEVTPEKVAMYAEITGDRNPLHFDEAFAAGTRFGRLVAHGGITTGILHALVAEDMPGPGSVFLSQNWKFTAPVYIGDTIEAAAVVAEVHATKPVCRLTIEVTRGEGEVVLEGEAWCYRFLVE